MDTEHRVVLYGDTVLLAGVGRALARRRELRVISLDPLRTTAPGDLDSLRPCAVILDLSVVSAESAVALARGRPDVLLIGLDPGGDRLVVLSGPRARALTIADLAWLIESRADGSERDRPGNRKTPPPRMAASGEQPSSGPDGDSVRCHDGRGRRRQPSVGGRNCPRHGAVALRDGEGADR